MPTEASSVDKMSDPKTRGDCGCPSQFVSGPPAQEDQWTHEPQATESEAPEVLRRSPFDQAFDDRYANDVFLAASLSRLRRRTPRLTPSRVRLTRRTCIRALLSTGIRWRRAPYQVPRSSSGSPPEPPWPNPGRSLTRSRAEPTSTTTRGSTSFPTMRSADSCPGGSWRILYTRGWD